MSRKIAIIGAGFGGLSAAIRLQASGYQVTLFDKAGRVGGHAAQFQRKGYSFDMGPSLITAPEIIEEIFAVAGTSLAEEVELIRLDPAYRIYFADGSHIDYSSDPEQMRKQLAAFDPRDAKGYDRFMKVSGDLYQAVIADGLGAMPFDNWGAMMRFVPRALKLGALLPSYTFARRYFRDPRSVFTFSFHPLFLGGSPFRAPAVYQMIPYLEREGGVWFTPGGMFTLVEAFERVFRRLGGEVRTGTEVERILVDQGRAVGVLAGGEEQRADLVISNADWMHTNAKLLEGSKPRKRWTKSKMKRIDYSMGAYLLYLGVKKQYPQLKHHTLILSPRYRELIRDIFDRHILPDDFSMYLHVPTRTDPSMAPEGCESMYVLIPVSNNASKIDWDEVAPGYTERVLDFLENDFGLEGLRESIEVQETFTPADFDRERNSYLGSAWGVEPKLTQTAIFRPHNRHEDVKNLYLVGASTHPGAGLPGVMLTAKTTGSLVLQDHPLNTKEPV